jgi:hypothetical protein
MKKTLRFSLAALAALLCTALCVDAQSIFSRFDFNGTPLITATIGPNGISTDPDAVIDGSAAYVVANCGSAKGIDLLIPNPGGLFDRASMGMAFRFRKEEHRSDFFVRGGTQFYQLDGNLYLRYRTSDGAGGTTNYGPINVGYSLPTDSLFHEYIFVYEHLNGIATVTVDGAPIYTFDGPDNRPFDWTAAPDPIVGTVMDGNCPGTGVLDYAYFFDPEVPLAAEFLSLQAAADEGDVQLDWAFMADASLRSFQVQRSRDGATFESRATLDALPGLVNASHRDSQPGGGNWYYRIVAEDVHGQRSSSETQLVVLAAIQGLRAWPNPSQGQLHLLVPLQLAGQPLYLRNLQGQTVQVQTAHEGHMTLELGNLPAGYYLLHAQAKGTTFRQQIIIR